MKRFRCLKSEVRYQTEDIRFLNAFETDPPTGGELAEGNDKNNQWGLSS